MLRISSKFFLLKVVSSLRITALKIILSTKLSLPTHETKLCIVDGTLSSLEWQPQTSRFLERSLCNTFAQLKVHWLSLLWTKGSSTTKDNQMLTLS